MNSPEPSASAVAAKLPTLTRAGPGLVRWIARGLIAAAALLVLYALSMGPALQLNKRGYLKVETLEKVYTPLSFFLDVPGLNRLFDSYIRLWIGPDPSPPRR